MSPQLSNLYLGYATLWFASKFPAKGSEKILEYAMDNILCDIQVTIHPPPLISPVKPRASRESNAS